MKDGISGFIVETVDQAVEAARKLEQIDREGCRNYFESRFSVESMADGYLEVYEALVAPQSTIRIPFRQAISKT